MDPQTIINAAIALVGFLGGWILKVVWEGVKDLQVVDPSKILIRSLPLFLLN